MSPLRASEYGLDDDLVTPAQALPTVVRRRLAGRYLVDPFGFDPQLSDLLAPLATTWVRFAVEGAGFLPASGPAALVVNRGVGVAEPTVVWSAVRATVGRRLRFLGSSPLPGVGTFERRVGAVAASAHDVAAVLRAGHLMAVPLGATWLRTRAGLPPLELVQAMMGFPCIPVAVRPSGPLGLPLRWTVRFGAPVTLADDYPPGDPLGAAELAEALRDAVGELLGGSPEPS